MDRLTTTLAAAAIICALAPPASSQKPLDLHKMGNDLRRNQEELRTYGWNSRITFKVNDVQRRVDEYQVRYDENGWLQRMQTGSKVADGAVRGPDGKKLKKKEREAALEFVTEAKNQLDAYLSPLFAEKAVKSSTVTTEAETITLRSESVVHQNDVVEIVFSAATHEPRTLQAVATIEGSPMSLEVTFGAIDYGPFHPAHSTTITSWNGFKLTIITETFDYSK